MGKNILIFFLLLHSLGYSQTLNVSGRILSGDSYSPIPFVSIAKENGDYIGLGNAQGDYSIRISTSIKKVIFSCVGYEPLLVSVEHLKENAIVYLQPDLTILSEVVITASHVTSDWLGTHDLTGEEKELSYGNSTYSAFGVPLKINNKPVKVLRAKVHIGNNEIGDFSLRCRVTKKGAGGVPGDDLLNNNVIISSHKKNGWVTFELEEYNLWVKENKSFLIIEVLHNKGYTPTKQVSTDIESPGFSYISKGYSVISTKPGVWRKDNKTMLIAVEVGYLNP